MHFFAPHIACGFSLVKEFVALATKYFDDYVILASVSEAAALASCVQLIFKMVGWDYTATGPKAPDYADIFQALGHSCTEGW